MRTFVTILAFVIYFTSDIIIFSQPWPVPVQPDTTGFGKNVSRTMYLLSSSTPQHRKKVKIMIYGQSISKQEWWLQTKNFVEKKYPFADLEMINLSIGGFSSVLLWRTVLMDVATWYPDLIIMQVTGDHRYYDTIVNMFRTYTTAEVCLQTDHIQSKAEIDEINKYGGISSYPSDWNNILKKNNGNWVNWMGFITIPAIATKYKCELIQLRTEWLKYIQNNDIEPVSLTIDGTHLNEQGNYLFAEITNQHLIYKYYDPDPDGLVKTYDVGKDIRFTDGKLKLEFTGNKIEFIAANSKGNNETAKILIDGKKPSEWKECYSYNRPNKNVGNDWPWTSGTFFRMLHNSPLVVENWILTFNHVVKKDSQIVDADYKVVGSVTGFDGTGSIGADFTSNTGRVIILKGDWWINKGFHQKDITDGSTVTWSVNPLFTDTYTTPQAITDTTKEMITNIVQGLPNTKHTLEIITKEMKGIPIKAIRIYRPLFGR